MTTKVINSSYDPETGISTVTISNKYGTFTGTSKLNPEDRDIASSLAGCRYAESRAIIKSLKAQLRIVRAEFKAFSNFYAQLSQSARHDADDYESQQLRRHLTVLTEREHELLQELDDEEAGLRASIRNYRKTVEAYIDYHNRRKDKIDKS